MAATKPFVYGQSPAPRNWREASDVLKQMTKQKRPKSDSLWAQLKRIEDQIKKMEKS